MRIEHLAGSPDRAGRFLLRFEDGETMRLYRQTVEDFGLYAGCELDDDQIAQLRKAAGEMSAKMRAVRIVSAASVSKRDLEQRLIQKGEGPVHAKEAVEWMEELHLLDDRNTAEQIVRAARGTSYYLLVKEDFSLITRENAQILRQVTGRGRAYMLDVFVLEGYHPTSIYDI